jgi:phage shock protein C
MFCTGCGQQISNETRYCPQCGKQTSAYSEGSARSAYAPRKLFRLPYDRKIAGVCAGIARLLSLDVTLIRILTVAITAFTGFIPGIIAYIFAWIIMPVEEAPARTASDPLTASSGS